MTYKCTWDIAEEFCREQLKLTDGTVEAGLKRIGTERFEKMILALESVMEKFTEKED